LLLFTYISNLLFWISLGTQNTDDQQVLLLLSMSSSVVASVGQGVSFPLPTTATLPGHQAIRTFPLVRRGNIRACVSLSSLPPVFVPCSSSLVTCAAPYKARSLHQKIKQRSCFTRQFHTLLISRKDLTDKRGSYRSAKLMVYFKLPPVLSVGWFASIWAVRAQSALQTDRGDNFVSQTILFHLCVSSRALIHISKCLLHLLTSFEMERPELNIAILGQAYFL